MKKGDGLLIYHSSAEPTAVVGTAEVVREGHPDPTQFDRKDDHYDPESRPEDPRWFQVEVRAVAKLPHPVTLERIKRYAGAGRHEPPSPRQPPLGAAGRGSGVPRHREARQAPE